MERFIKHVTSEFQTWSLSHFVFDAALTIVLTTLLRVVTEMDWLPLTLWGVLILVLVTSGLNVFLPHFETFVGKRGRARFTGTSITTGEKRLPKPQAKESDLTKATISGVSFDILQLPRELMDNGEARSTVIKNKTIVDCDIHGPAILAIMGGTSIVGEMLFTRHTKQNRILWEYDGPDAITGPITLFNCRLVNCHFIDIAFMCSSHNIEEAKELLSASDVVKVGIGDPLPKIAERIEREKSSIGQLNANVLDPKNNPNKLDRTQLLESLRNTYQNLEQIVKEIRES